MRILDWRPWPERRLASAGTDIRTGWLAALAGRATDAVTARRVARRPEPPADMLVVSVGNLRVGGTGKTPVVQALARDLAARGISGAVLTRGYRARTREPLRVQADDPRAADEARMLAASLTPLGWTVVQAPSRREGLELLRTRIPPPRVVLLEDGHQTAGVGRHMDVVILDDWAVVGGNVEPRTGAVLPLGPYRETARGADRAEVWLLESAALPASPAAAVVTGFARRMEIVGVSAAEAPEGALRVGLVSGLARPEGFERGCAGVLPIEPVLAVRCRDHCDYDSGLLARVLTAGDDLGVQSWLTTEKDWVKLQALWPDGVPIAVARLTVGWTGDAKTLPDLVEERLGVLGAGTGSA